MNGYIGDSSVVVTLTRALYSTYTVKTPEGVTEYFVSWLTFPDHLSLVSPYDVFPLRRVDVF